MVSKMFGRALLLITVASSSLAPPAAQGQDRPGQWERRLEATAPPLTAFHSTQVINLPTTETLGRGEWQFEISHRFRPAISQGSEVLYGLDGPVYMRLGLGYAPTDRLLVTAARSNLEDNWDLRAKVRALAIDQGPIPLLLAFQGGVAWSNELLDQDRGDNGKVQYYGQLVMNTLVADRLALGIVPSYLYNVLLDETDPVSELYWGLYGQLYLSNILSVNAEWNLGPAHGEFDHDPGAVGIELETGGHFFKIFVTNSVRLNPSQYLAGTEFPFDSDQWRLGFAITRLLRF
jgi:hypothetical protein